MRSYSVGGSVRDELLGLTPHDFDCVVIGATPAMMLARGFTQVGADFPVFLCPKTHEQHALARQERKVGSGHRGFETVFSPDITLEEDLSRRDLTINAMAKDPETGEIIDPFGGREDLRLGILRHVSEAFSEDPLRVLRLARFQAKTGFSIAPETFELACRISASGALRELSFERVRAELVKLAQEPNAVLGLRSLMRMGALDSFDPEWSARLSEPHLEAFERASQSELPATARVAFLFGPMPPKEAQSLLERLLFSQEEQRFFSRLMAARQWALDETPRPPAERSVSLIESAGLAKASEPEARVFWQCLAWLAPKALDHLESAKRALTPYQNTDIRQAVALPEGSKKDGAEIGRRVAAARLESVRSALSSPKPAPGRRF